MQKRVLIVDDDPLIRELLTSVLVHESLEVDCADDGRQALELMRTREYAVVLLDLLMPQMNGFDVLKEMDEETRPVVLVITGADHSTIAELDARIVHGIVRKPFEPLELAELVRACAEIRGRGSLGAMAIATVIAGSPLFALYINRF
ncbi:MAG TPA: response regulator [Thermoanaerobaculia bacterium]|nr:response regulator [Thermoanaerobaculia bacterium]